MSLDGYYFLWIFNLEVDQKNWILADLTGLQNKVKNTNIVANWEIIPIFCHNIMNLL